jgi:hypothetical protein
MQAGTVMGMQGAQQQLLVARCWLHQRQVHVLTRLLLRCRMVCP